MEYEASSMTRATAFGPQIRRTTQSTLAMMRAPCHSRRPDGPSWRLPAAARSLPARGESEADAVLRIDVVLALSPRRLKRELERPGIAALARQAPAEAVIAVAVRARSRSPACR